MTTGGARIGNARADLHTHSSASDGLLAPAGLIRQASERGLSVLALTDHDTTLGLDEARRAGRELGVRVISGVELSTGVDEGQLHVLGYGFNERNPDLLTRLATLRASRAGRALAIIERLRELGVAIDAETARPTRPGESIGRPHIARAMVGAGHVGSVAEAFERYLGDGRPAYVASRRLTPEAAVQLIVEAGGVAVLAHPYSYPAFRERLPSLIAAGLQGIEVYYGEHSCQQIDEMERVADRRGLLAAGGSDYHGDIGSERRALGSARLPDDALARFLRRLDSGSALSD
ncbi:MAG TPA: PHP domain-containing protein [Thermomicrobiales bacterium]|nr:PHP domain-containing protein [Thermomicrobiales bacterium]